MTTACAPQAGNQGDLAPSPHTRSSTKSRRRRLRDSSGSLHPLSPRLSSGRLPTASCLSASFFAAPPSPHAPVSCKSLWCPCDPRGGPPLPRPGCCLPSRPSAPSPRPGRRHLHLARAVQSSGMAPPRAPASRPEGSLAPLEGRIGAIFMSVLLLPLAWPRPEWAFNGLRGGIFDWSV